MSRCQFYTTGLKSLELLYFLLQNTAKLGFLLDLKAQRFVGEKVQLAEFCFHRGLASLIVGLHSLLNRLRSNPAAFARLFYEFIGANISCMGRLHIAIPMHLARLQAGSGKLGTLFQELGTLCNSEAGALRCQFTDLILQLTVCLQGFVDIAGQLLFVHGSKATEFAELATAGRFNGMHGINGLAMHIGTGKTCSNRTVIAALFKSAKRIVIAGLDDLIEFTGCHHKGTACIAFRSTGDNTTIMRGNTFSTELAFAIEQVRRSLLYFTFSRTVAIG